MKLLLVNDSGESLACLDKVEEYDTQNSGNVLALLDLLESLIASAKGKPIAPESTMLTSPSRFCGHTGARLASDAQNNSDIDYVPRF